MSQATEERRYTAFISYRHAPADTRVAKEIHRSLERYHLDRSVRQKSGFTSLAPVFRDEDELPISSALDDDLVKALRNASALVVVCSPRTNESAWCAREVDEFLKTHSQSRVFVALVEGEPHDVVPPRLLYKLGPDGEQIPMEPLAANFRPECRGQARRNEVTRLAAGILGVPYDSLVRRAQRRRQRIAAALGSLAVAASTAFGVYNAYMNAQVRANYERAMRQRSEYLATEAEQLLAEGNTLGATELALAALPNEADPATADRPVVPQAVYALQRATGAAISNVAGTTLGAPPPHVSEAYVTEADLRTFDVSPNGRYVAAADEGETVYVWEVDGHREAFAGRSSLGAYEDVRDLYVRDDGTVLVVYETGVVCRDAADGSVRWDSALGDPDAPVRTACLGGEERQWLLVALDARLVVLDVDDGTVLHELAYADVAGFELGDGDLTFVMTQPVWGTDRFALSVSVLDAQGALAGSRVLCVAMPSGEARAFDAPGDYAYRLGLTADGAVLLMLAADGNAPVSTENLYYGTTYLETHDSVLRVCCLDGDTGQVRWQDDEHIWNVCYDAGFAELDDRETGLPGGVVAWWATDRVKFVDSATGTVLADLTCETSVAGANLLDDGGTLMVIEVDGSLFFAWKDSTSVNASRSLGSSLFNARVMPSGDYYLVRGDTLYAYRGLSYDGSVATRAVPHFATSWEFAGAAGFVTVAMEDEEDVLAIDLWEAPGLEPLWSTSFGADDDLLWYPIAYDQAEDALVLLAMAYTGSAYETTAVVRLRMATQEVERWDAVSATAAGLALPATGSGGAPAEVAGVVVGNGACYVDGVVWSQVEDAQGTVGIAAAALATGTSRAYGVAEGFGQATDRGGRRLYLSVAPGGAHVFYQNVRGTWDEAGLGVMPAAVLDPATGASAVLPHEVADIWDGTLTQQSLYGRVLWSDDGATLGCVSSEGVRLYDFGAGGVGAGQLVALDGRRVRGAWLGEAGLVVALSSGFSAHLERYDPATGARLARAVLDEEVKYARGWALVPSALRDGTGDLFVATSFFGYLVDAESLQVCQRVEGATAYGADLDALLCQGADNASYRALGRWTLAGLVARGQVLTDGQTMGAAWLTAHGA